MANKTYSLKNQKKLRLYLQKQENGTDIKPSSNADNKSRERTKQIKSVYFGDLSDYLRYVRNAALCEHLWLLLRMEDWCAF